MVEAIKDFKEDIVCSMDATGRHVNIQRRIVRHSPTGFAWGYGGSGPADLALNILSVFIGQADAESLYQDFKRMSMKKRIAFIKRTNCFMAYKSGERRKA
jgi:hypothetical protein